MVTFDQNSLTNGNGAAIYNEGVIASDDMTGVETFTYTRYVAKNPEDETETKTYYSQDEKAALEALLSDPNKKIRIIVNEVNPEVDAEQYAAIDGKIADGTYYGSDLRSLMKAENYWLPTTGGIKDSVFTGNTITNGLGTVYNNENGIISFTGKQVFEKNSVISDNAIKGVVISNSGVIGNLNGDFVENYALTGTYEEDGSTVKTQGSNVYGGAISNWRVISQIGLEDSYSNFKGNYAKSVSLDIWGAAIYSNGENAKIGDIYANFEGNYLVSGQNATGGAIRNSSSSSMGNIIGNFIENHITAKLYGAGAALYNGYNGSISNITGDFIGNYIEAGRNAKGGALYNSEGKIENITGNFSGNYIETGTREATGGAVYNNGVNTTIKSITGDFTGNYAKSTSGTAQGGGIYNSGEITNLYGDFEGNYVESGDESTSIAGGAVSGGAIYNTGTIGQIGSANNYSSFKGNYAKSYGGEAEGGAVYNDKTINNVYANFDNNSITTGSSANANGGALYVTGTGNIDSLKGSFSQNSANANSGLSRGGAIYTRGKITTLEANFTNNSSISVSGEAHGGAVFVTNSGIDNLYGNFVGNKAISDSAGVSGGAIYNNAGATIQKIVGDFIGNEVMSNIGIANGAAIYNGGKIGDIKGDFIQNNVLNGCYGAIYNEGEINSIIGDFSNNNLYSSYTGETLGAAIRLSGGTNTAVLKKVVGNFIGNSVVKETIDTLSSQNVGGGAIAAVIGQFGDIIGNFINNSVKSNTKGTVYGGAISLSSNASVERIKGDFIENTLTATGIGGKAEGGAIKVLHSASGIGNITGNFLNNVASSAQSTAKGGAIWNVGSIGLLADYRDITFYNNRTISGSTTAYNDIYNTSTINLNANTGRQISFGGTIDGSSGTLNLNRGVGNDTDGYVTAGTTGGQYIFNNTVSGQNMYLYNNAQVKLGSVKQQDGTTTYGSLNLTSLTNDANGGFIDTRNVRVDSSDISGSAAQNLGSITLGSDLHMAIEGRSDSSGNDRIEGTMSNANGHKIIIDAINKYGSGNGTTLVTSTLGEYIALATSINNYDQEKHIFHVLGSDNHIYTASYIHTSGESTGSIKYEDTGIVAKNLAYYVANGDGVNEATYKMYVDEQVINSLGAMQGNGYTLNIDGQGNTIHGNGNNGIWVKKGQKFSADNVTFEGFSGEHFMESSDFYGGNALEISGTIENLNANFTNNVMYGTVDNIHMGGAVLIHNNLSVNSVGGKYSYNGIIQNEDVLKAALGGALYESAKVDKISANFEGNFVSAINAGANGGAIAVSNHAKINNLSSTFSNNYTKSSGGNASGGGIYNPSIIASDDSSNRQGFTVTKYTVSKSGSPDITYYKKSELTAMEDALANSKIYVVTAEAAGTDDYDTVKAALDAGDETTYLAKSPAILIGADAYWTPQNGGIKESTFSGNYVEASASGAMAAGGAIYNAESGAIHFDGHQIFENNRATATGSAYAYGAAIYNAGVIGDLDAEFRNNVVESGSNGKAYGAALYNAGIIRSIGSEINRAVFSDNAMQSSAIGHLGGGALYNTNKISSVYADFVRNKSSWDGGALENNGEIGTVVGNFEGNSAKYGGAIINNGSIKSIGEGTVFKNNYVESASDVLGGAVENHNLIEDLNASFIGNYAVSKTSTAQGGAVYNRSKIDNLKGTFTNNYVKSDTSGGSGGAIYNTGTIDDIYGTFIGNYAESGGWGQSRGGAIWNSGKIENLSGTFEDNHAKSDVHQVAGGAIYNQGTITNLSGIFNKNTALSGATADTAMNQYSKYTNGGAVMNNGGIIYNLSGSFDGNKSTFGGAVYVEGVSSPDRGFIDSISGTFTNNEATDQAGAVFVGNNGATVNKINAIFTGNSSRDGAAIRLNTNAVLKDLKGTFTDNKGTNTGAISNGGTIEKINADFTNNKATQERDFYARGGAISSTVSIGTITGTFKNNSVTGKSYTDPSTSVVSYTGGGAIYNAGTIDDIHADFVGNTATGTDYSSLFGGAIYNNGGTIKNVTGTFRDNEAEGTARPNDGIKNAQAGAIANMNGGTMTISDSTFNGNTSTWDAGAVMNGAGSTTTVKNSLFINNKAGNGAAIYSGYPKDGEAGILNIYDSEFRGNQAFVAGGALMNYLPNSTNIYAKYGDTIFVNNTVQHVQNYSDPWSGTNTNPIKYNDVTNWGLINMDANAGRKVSFGGEIEGVINTDSNPVLNIGSDSTVKGGEVVFNNTVSGNTVNLSSGTSVHLGSITLPSLTTPNTNETYYGQLNLNALNVSASGGLINAINNVVSQGTTAQNLGAVTLNGDLKLGLDLDADNAIGDIFTASSVSQGSGVSGKKILISQINLIGTYSDPIVVATDAYVGANMGVGSDLIISGSNLGYGLTTASYSWSSTDGKGYLEFDNDDDVDSLSAAVLDTNPDHASRAYVMRTNETITTEAPLGNLGGTSLSVDTKGYDVNGGGQEGIRVSAGQSLSITGGGTWSGFGSDVLWNSGNITNIEIDFSDNHFSSIYNYGGVIDSISGNFTNNEKQLTNYSQAGGVYNREGKIGSINGNFIGNKVSNAATVDIDYIVGGSAIYEQGQGTNSSVIGSVIGSFVNNAATSQVSKVYGAVTLFRIIDSIGSITGKEYTLTTSDVVNTDASDVGKTISGFYGNTASSTDGQALGGSIYNAGTIGDIDADFIKNKAESTNSSAQGGAIWNSGTIGDITGDFTDNEANNQSITEWTDGGAIWNSGTIGDIGTEENKSLFKNNKASSYRGVRGGAILNDTTGKIGDIYADFEDNSITRLLSTEVSSDNREAWGGAIMNYGSIGNIVGDFKNNTILDKGGDTRGPAWGGAIFNYRNTSNIKNITGNFENNKAESEKWDAHGGAIANYAGTIENITGNFKNNLSSGLFASSGALKNTSGGDIRQILDSAFEQNQVKAPATTGMFVQYAYGGAINNDSTIGLISNTIFASNTAEATNSTAYGGGVSNVRGVIGTDENVASKLSGYYRYVVTYINGDTVETTTVYDKTAYDDIGAKVANGDVFIPSVYDNYIILDASVEGDTAKWNAYNDTTTSSAYTKTDPKSQMKAENWYVPEGDGLTNVAFVGNEAKGTSAYGGAIYNTGAIGKITGKEVEVEYTDTATNEVLTKKVKGFYGNKATGTGTEGHASGGAIYNEGVISEIVADFEGNEANISYVGVGGIYNHGYIGNIIGNFKENSIIDSNTEKSIPVGGAIQTNGFIDSIKGNFERNYINVTDGEWAQAAAIYVGPKGVINSIEGDFIGNYIINNTLNDYYTYGGAIWLQYGGKIGTLKGNFNGNYISAVGSKVAGGAIDNHATISEMIGDFTNNYIISTNNLARGGAIYNTGTLGNIVDSNFTDNYAKGNNESQGGAIFNNYGVITISAENKDSKFSGNKVINIDENGSEIANRYHNSEFQNMEFYTYCSVIDNFYNY